MGPSGGSVWSTVALDPAVGRLYCTTGNQYTGKEEKYIDSIIALELNTGKPVWFQSVTACPDAWGGRSTPASRSQANEKTEQARSRR